MRKLRSSFEHYGFSSEVRSERHYNVVCITKTNDQKNLSYFHQPITGIAKVKTIIESANRLEFAHTVVEFEGVEYDFISIGHGLDGTALVIGIAVEDGEYNQWELYTDSPSPRPDRPGEVITSDTIRQKANHAVANRRRY